MFVVLLLIVAAFPKRGNASELGTANCMLRWRWVVERFERSEESSPQPFFGLRYTYQPDRG